MTPSGSSGRKSASGSSPMATTARTLGQSTSTALSWVIRRGSTTMTSTSAWLTICRIWSFISCLFNGVNTAPMQVAEKSTSRCSAQLYINVPTR